MHPRFFIIPIIIFFFSYKSVFCNYNEGNTKGIDTSECKVFIDNKSVWVADVIKGLENETIEYVYGAYSKRDAILLFGEKFRNGYVYFYVTVRKKDEEI